MKDHDNVQPPSEKTLRAIYLAFRSTVHTQRGLALLAGDAATGALRAAGCRVAGHAVLLVIEDAAAAKQAVRSGWCDFLVTTVDEALRVLKLAVRRGSANAVVLRADPAAVLRECVERGVQPELIDVAVRELEERGAQRIAWLDQLETGEQWVHWHATAGVAAALERVNAAAMACIEAQREEKLRWLKRAPRALGRTGAWSRGLPLTVEECTAFRSVYATVGVADSVTVEWGSD